MTPPDDLPPTDDPAQRKAMDELRLGLMGIDLGPIYDFAEGQKAELERRGWSPTAAEAAATVVLCSALQRAFAG